MTTPEKGRYRPEHEYLAISWRGTPIIDLDREDLLEALYWAFIRLQRQKKEITK